MKNFSQETDSAILHNIETAFEHHKAGRLALALELYQQVLQVIPDHPDSLHLSGLIFYHDKKPEIAVKLIKKAIQFRPDFAEAWYNLGKILRSQAKFEEAARCYCKAIEITPWQIDIYNSLGFVLELQGKLSEAENNYQKAVSINPDYAPAYINLGNIFYKTCRLKESEKSFRKALSINPDFPEALNNLGLVLRTQGNLKEAEIYHRKAIMIRPDYADAYLNLGSLAKTSGNFNDAIAYIEKSITLQPNYAEAYYNLGNVLRLQGKLEQAKLNYHKALSIREFAKPYNGLGQISVDCGNFSEAQEYFSKALSIEPNNIEALTALPNMRKMTSDDLDWEKNIKHLLSQTTLPEDEVSLCFALGKYYDDVHEYEKAFAVYERGNKICIQINGVFDRADFKNFIDTTIASYSQKSMKQENGYLNPSSRPLFIVGMPRSGTSLLEQIVASHPAVYGAGELSFWIDQALPRLSNISSWHCDTKMLQEIAVKLEAQLLELSPSATLVVDKMPGNFQFLGLIHDVCPNAHILHIHRNPIDTCLSIYFQNFSNRHPYSNDLDDLAFYYREYYRLMNHWREVLPSRVFMDVSYESLVADQESWTRRILNFIGLEWNENCIEFHKTERRVGTASNWQVKQKIFKTSLERWKNYEKFIEPLLLLSNKGELGRGR